MSVEKEIGHLVNGQNEKEMCKLAGISNSVRGSAPSRH